MTGSRSSRWSGRSKWRNQWIVFANFIHREVGVDVQRRSWEESLPSPDESLNRSSPKKQNQT
jgi:hypothetical protein